MPESDQNLLTVGDVARRLRLNSVTVQRWCRSGRLPNINLGGAAGYRIREEDIAHLLFQDYGRIESLARRVAAAEAELAEAPEDYASGLEGAAREDAVRLSTDVAARRRESLGLADRFKGIRMFVIPGGIRRGRVRSA